MDTVKSVHPTDQTLRRFKCEGMVKAGLAHKKEAFPVAETPVIAMGRQRPPWMWPQLAAGVLFVVFAVGSTGGAFHVNPPESAIVWESASNDFEIFEEANAPQEKAGGASEPGPEAAATPRANRAASAPELVSLFNGKDLAGWRLPGNASQSWKVIDGVLEGSGRPAASTLLTTRTDFANFRLRVETRSAEGLNGAIQFRVTQNNGQRAAYNAIIGGTGGAENARDVQTGSLRFLETPTATVTLVTPDPVVPIKPGEWFTEEVIADGDVITILVKGTEVAKFKLVHKKLLSGAIGLLCRPNSKVAFRRIEISELERNGGGGSEKTSSSFDTSRTARVGPRGHWQIENDELVQTTLDSDAWIVFGDRNWTDYTFIADVKLVESKAHVGLYFRNPGEARGDNHFFYTAGFRAHDTGSICRVVGGNFKPLPARRNRDAVLTPGKWQSMQIDVRGERFTAYLDGQPVFSASDSANPKGRVGLRAWESVCRFRNVKVTSPDGKTLWEGLPELLTSDSVGVALRGAKGRDSRPSVQGARRADSEQGKAGPARASAVTLKEVAVLKIPGGSINGLSLSDDGGRLGVAAIAPLPGGGWPAGQVSVWDVAKQQQLWVEKNPSVARVYSPVHRVWLTPDGKTIVTAESRWGTEGAIHADTVVTFKVWDAATGKLKRKLPDCKGDDVAASMSPDGRLFAISPGLEYEMTRGSGGRGALEVYTNGRVMIWDLSSPTLKCSIPGKSWTHELGPGVRDPREAGRGMAAAGLVPVRALAFSLNRPQIAVAYSAADPSVPSALKIWDVDKATEILALKGTEGPKDFSAQLQWLADGKTLALRYGVVPKVWMERQPQPPKPLPDMNGPRRATALEVWDTNKPARKQAFILTVGGPDDSGTKHSVLSADGSRLFVHVTNANLQANPPAKENRVVVWDVAARRRLATLQLPAETPGQGDRTNQSRITAGKSRGPLGIGTMTGGISVHIGRNGPSLSRIGRVGDSGESYQDVPRDARLALSPDGKVLAVGDGEGVIRVYDVASSEDGPNSVP
jgi:WD40 repeat protein